MTYTSSRVVVIVGMRMGTVCQKLGEQLGNQDWAPAHQEGEIVCEKTTLMIRGSFCHFPSPRSQPSGSTLWVNPLGQPSGHPDPLTGVPGSF